MTNLQNVQKCTVSKNKKNRTKILRIPLATRIFQIEVRCEQLWLVTLLYTEQIKVNNFEYNGGYVMNN